MLLLKQEDIQKMAYQSHKGVYYSEGNEEKLRKKINRNIVINYILSSLLGAAVSAGAILSTKNPKIAKKIFLGTTLVIAGASIIYYSVSIIKDLIKLKKEKQK